MEILLALAGLAVGAVAAFLFARRAAPDAAGPSPAETLLKEKLAEAAATERELRDRLQHATNAAAGLAAELKAEKEQAAEKLQVLADARAQLSDHFKALTADALAAERQRLKDEQEIREKAIKGLVSPLTETLAKFDKRVEEMGKERAEKDGAFVRQIGELGRETRALVHALKTPHVKGRWGDRMPAGRVVVVDAKAPTLAFLAAVEAGDEEARGRHLADHARQVRDHFTRLSQKAYWDQFADAPEFVVMFVPGESFFSAAVQADPALLDDAANDRVLIATPTTLLSLLWAVERGWRQEKLAENARAISDQGRELFKRMTDMAGHLTGVGDGLRKAVDAYNRSVGSLETRVFPAARRLKELGAGPEDAELGELAPVEKEVKAISKPELLGPAEIKH
jgi:DNA recombination protein RmuC